MQYLTIRNVGVCPKEGFTVLGVSSARGNDEAIGQFGSGAKHGVLTCLRMGINPVIYCGREKIQFHTEPAKMGDSTDYNKVFVKVGTKAPRELSIAMEYGALDWTNVDMALREFVSNALDAVAGDPSKVDFKICERIWSDSDSTIIGVPLTPDVQKWYNHIGDKFLQFAGGELYKQKILPKLTKGPAKIYRKGVFIREIQDASHSLFDYNFGSELYIDESRNLDDYRAKDAAIDAIGTSVMHLKEAMLAISRGEDIWEAGFGGWDLCYVAKNHPALWQTAWAQAFGNNAVCSMMNDGSLTAQIQAKGFIPIDMYGWYQACKDAGIKVWYQVLDDMNAEGHQLMDPTPQDGLVALRDKVWGWLQAFDMTQGKSKPPVKKYRDIMKSGATRMGYYKDGTVYINEEDQGNPEATMLEELTHYVTGATDSSRDFQNFLLQMLVRALN